jgi:hypothetical protein
MKLKLALLTTALAFGLGAPAALAQDAPAADEGAAEQSAPPSPDDSGAAPQEAPPADQDAQ